MLFTEHVKSAMRKNQSDDLAMKQFSNRHHKRWVLSVEKHFRLLVFICSYSILLVFSNHLAAQCNYAIHGLISEEHTNEPLDFAVIQLIETKQTIYTDSVGKFTFTNLCKGQYTLLFTHAGCETESKSLYLQNDTTILLQLHHNEIDLNEVVVSQHKRESAPTQQVEVLKEQTLFATRGLSLGDALATITGVSVLKTGATIAKPMIHGMTGNRILLVNNGVRLEGQQWGADHAPEIDVYLAKKITVIKGASAIRYGSDAIGGVVLLDPDPLPTKNGIGSEINYTYGSINQQHDISATVQGNHKKAPAFSWRTQGTFKRGGNVRTPNYYQKNTGFYEANGSVNLGWKKEKYGIEAFASYFNTHIGILSIAHTESLQDLYAAINAQTPKESAGFSYKISRPYQAVEHILGKLQTYYSTQKGTIHFFAAYQHDTRQEFDKYLPRNDSIAALNRPQMQLKIQTVNGELAWEYRFKKWESIVGAQFFTQTNNYKYAFLIPAYWNMNGGVFAVERWANEKMEVELGVRLDYRWMQAMFYNKAAKTHQYIMPTVSAGFDYHISKNLKWNIHAGLAWRAPSMNELYINGVHSSIATLEIGNPNLKAEKSLNISTGIDYSQKYVHLDASLYTHLFKDFIYMKPDTHPTLTIRGWFPVARYVQTDAAISGSDINLRVLPVKGLELSAKAALIFALNLKTKDWLEMIPAHRFNYGIRYTIDGKKSFRNLYFGFNISQVLKQNQLPQNNTDYLPAPNGYWLLNFDSGTEIFVFNQKISIGFSIQNMLNKAYRDYMNRFRYFTDEAGVNVMLRLKVPLFFH